MPRIRAQYPEGTWDEDLDSDQLRALHFNDISVHRKKTSFLRSSRAHHKNHLEQPIDIMGPLPDSLKMGDMVICNISEVSESALSTMSTGGEPIPSEMRKLTNTLKPHRRITIDAVYRKNGAIVAVDFFVSANRSVPTFADAPVRGLENNFDLSYHRKPDATISTNTIYTVANNDRFFSAVRKSGIVADVKKELWLSILASRSASLIHNKHSFHIKALEGLKLDSSVERQGFTLNIPQSAMRKPLYVPDMAGGDFMRAESPLLADKEIEGIIAFAHSFVCEMHRKGMHIFHFPPFADWPEKFRHYELPDRSALLPPPGSSLSR